MTIKDLAAQTGYAVGTVSRALNDHPNVSPKAREAILSAAREAGFQLNTNAKQLKQQRSTSILVLIKGADNALFSAMAEQIQRLVSHTRYRLVLDYMDEDQDEVRRAIQLCREKKPLGILFLGGNGENFTASFRQIDVPCVLLTGDARELGFPNLSSVTIDDRAAARHGVELLLSLGHRRVAVIGGHRERSDISALRYQGCMDAFRASGVEFDPERDYASARFSYAGGYQAARQLLSWGRDFTAIFAGADVLAIGAIRALAEAGLRVPQDVSVMGMDGLPLGEYLVPGLASISQSAQEIARQGVEILLAAIDDKQPTCHVCVPFTLRQGESIVSRP